MAKHMIGKAKRYIPENKFVGPADVEDIRALDVQGKFQLARQAMHKGMIDREGEIDLVLTALICQEHPLLVGPPGTGKSMLLDNVMRWMEDGVSKFSILVNKFSTPEEVFGPISVQGLKEDVYRRITTGKLPEAHLAFIDEIFKASTAILNTMLRILNERMYENGDGTFRKCPLKLCVAASNEWPGDDGKELHALFDRFLFRKKVMPIRNKASRHKLLWRNEHKVEFTDFISPLELDEAFQEMLTLEWEEDAADAVEEILDKLAGEGIMPGDRRQVKSIRACKAFAYLNGAATVSKEHLEILAHTLWDDPNEQPEKTAKIVAAVANPVGMAINGLLLQAEDVVAKNEAAAAVPKLREINKQLGALAVKNESHKRTRSAAMEYVGEEIKRLYDNVLGMSSK